MTALVLAVFVSSPPASSTEWIEFIGFSSDERVAAYRHDLRVANSDGTHDHYSVVHTIDVETGRGNGIYRSTGIRRMRPDGREMKVRMWRLLRDNPEYAAASPRTKLRRTLARHRFRRISVAADGGAVDVDGASGLEADRTRESITIAAGVGQTLAFRTIVRDVHGNSVEVGAFSRLGLVANGGWIAASVQFYASPSGRAVAVVTTFLLNDGPARHTEALLAVSSLSDSPLDALSSRRR